MSGGGCRAPEPDGRYLMEKLAYEDRNAASRLNGHSQNKETLREEGGAKEGVGDRRSAMEDLGHLLSVQT
jgi:hypothetical protein